MTKPRKIRCAIYTRKSTEEGLDQEFNSLDAQHEACAAYIASQKHEGWRQVSTRYDDGGKSGGNLERPALQQLIADIEAGRIDMVVVYKIDRLTRSLADFAKLVERFEAVDCSFVSVTQAFNTSSSMGRLTLNVLLSFAQFEREVTAERIRDKITASKKKGLWMGGLPPLGYDPVGDRTQRRLVVNEDEAVTVRRIFDLYVELGCLSAVQNQAKAEGLRSKYRHFASGRKQGGTPFSRGQIYHVLRNPIYIGQIRHKGQVHPGQHAPIIAQDLWENVQAKLRQASARKRGATQAVFGNAIAAPLLGKFCDETGDRLTPSHTQKSGKRHGYYVSNRLVSGRPDPTAWRLPAKPFDRAIAQVIHDHLRDGAVERFEILRTPDAAAVERISAQATALAETIEAGDTTLLASLIVEGRLAPGEVTLTLSAEALATNLEVPAADLAPRILQITALFTCRRRGVETRIVAGRPKPTPDRTLIRALKNAHAWVAKLKAGETIRQVADAASRSESYVARILPLAFLSPGIQTAIIEGTQPPEFTLEILVRQHIPTDWSAQETQFGFARTG